MRVRVREIAQVDSRTLRIRWTDGTDQQWDVVALRDACPCAACVDEWTGERIAPPAPASTRPEWVRSVGRYALQIGWTDGHATGIYTFDTLRALD